MPYQDLLRWQGSCVEQSSSPRLPFSHLLSDPDKVWIQNVLQRLFSLLELVRGEVQCEISGHWGSVHKGHWSTQGFSSLLSGCQEVRRFFCTVFPPWYPTMPQAQKQSVQTMDWNLQSSQPKQLIPFFMLIIFSLSNTYINTNTDPYPQELMTSTFEPGRLVARAMIDWTKIDQCPKLSQLVSFSLEGLELDFRDVSYECLNKGCKYLRQPSHVMWEKWTMKNSIRGVEIKEHRKSTTAWFIKEPLTMLRFVGEPCILPVNVTFFPPWLN